MRAGLSPSPVKSSRLSSPAPGPRTAWPAGRSTRPRRNSPVAYRNRAATVLARPSRRYTTKMPHLRSDAHTLVVGRIQPCDTLISIISCTLASNHVRLELSYPLPESEPDNFFLVSMVEQWKSAKDQPALIRADRALAFA